MRKIAQDVIYRLELTEPHIEEINIDYKSLSVKDAAGQKKKSFYF